MTFNRIKTLTNSVRDIEIAVSTSELLQLSGDRKAVRRVTDIVDKSDTDECTIYVVRSTIGTDPYFASMEYSLFDFCLSF